MTRPNTILLAHCTEPSIVAAQVPTPFREGPGAKAT